MKKACKELMKRNSKMEKQILKANDEIYTNMIVYIRASDLTEYNQEVVREDLINMIIDGQNRGDDIEKIIGGNYKEVCDEIIDAMPKKNMFQKVMSTLTLGTSILWIIGAIYFAKGLIFNIANGNRFGNFVLSMGDVFNILLIIFLANFIVIYIGKTSFQKKSKGIKSFLKTWIFLIIVLIALVCSAYFLDFTIIDVSMKTAFISIVGLLVFDVFFSKIVDEKIL